MAHQIRYPHNSKGHPPQDHHTPGSLYDVIHTMPKVELHRHLEGSLRIQTLIDIALAHKIELFGQDIRPLVQMMPDEPRNWQNFMSKFSVLRQFFVTPEIIRRITREAIEDAAEDNVKYMELRFTPRALSNVVHCETRDIVAWVCDAAAAAAAEYKIMVRLIVSVNRHESITIAEEAAQAAVDHRHLGVVGLDLAGIEAGHSAYLFRDIFRRARGAGLGITLHAGEWQGAESIWDAVSNVGTDRIGHGIRALEDPGIVNVLLERKIVLEVCPSSNVDTGAHPDLASHPLRGLIASGLQVTINTDDPLVFDVTLTDELVRTVNSMQLTVEDLKRHTLVAVEAAFLPEAERQALLKRFNDWLYPK